MTTVSTAVSSRTSSTNGTRSANATTTVAPESDNRCWISRVLYCGFIGTTAPPARSVPWKPTTNCGRFGRYSATRSPGSTPASANPDANAPVWPQSVR